MVLRGQSGEERAPSFVAAAVQEGQPASHIGFADLDSLAARLAESLERSPQAALRPPGLGSEGYRQ